MMIKLTERCTMGCIHCLNDAKPDGEDMTLDVLEDTLNFLYKHQLGRFLIITGGEPLEHNNFVGMMKHLLKWIMSHYSYIQIITVTTNGEKIVDDPAPYQALVELYKEYGIPLLFQVSADTRYYPRRIPTHKKVFRSEGFELVDNCIVHMYPQGRAADNNLPWKSLAPRCFNVRSIARSIDNNLAAIEYALASFKKFCTPHIKINGDIGLGESDLCPPCGSIYDTEQDILDKIKHFKCHQCDIVFNTMSDKAKAVLAD